MRSRPAERQRRASMSRISVVAAIWLWTSAASAHPLLDEARGAAESADFPRARALLERLDRANDLDRAELPDFLFTSAMVHFALGQEVKMQRDLARLARVAPDYALSDTVAPGLRDAFERARRTARPVALEATASAVPGGVEIRASRPDEDAAGVVRAIRIHARAPGSEWIRSESATYVVPAPPGAVIEYWVEAIGPGGARVASAGSADEPRVVRMGDVAPASSTADRAPPSTRLDERDRDAPIWPFVVGGAAVLVAGAVALFFVLSSNDPESTQFSAPTVVGWP